MLINLTDNCTLRPDEIHISDFGLVYHSSQNGSVVGTFPYVAPEILLQSNSAATLSSDMWAAGCIGYELCTGQQLPHTLRCSLDNLDDLQEYADCIDLVAIAEQGLGPLTINVIGRCLAWYPQNRPTAAQMRDEIGEIIISRGYRETRSLTLSSTGSENVDLTNPAAEEGDGATPSTASQSLHVEDSNIPGIIVQSEAGMNLMDVDGGSTGAGPVAESQMTREILGDRIELEENFDWTTGGNASLRHRKVIDKGASGEVHEVRLLQS